MVESYKAEGRGRKKGRNFYSVSVGMRVAGGRPVAAHLSGLVAWSLLHFFLFWGVGGWGGLASKPKPNVTKSPKCSSSCRLVGSGTGVVAISQYYLSFICSSNDPSFTFALVVLSTILEPFLWIKFHLFAMSRVISVFLTVPQGLKC